MDICLHLSSCRYRRDSLPLYLLVQRFSHLSLASASRPEGLAFNQERLDQTRLALTTQGSDDFP